MPSPKPLDREVMLQSFRQAYATVGRRPNRDEVAKYCIAKYGTYYKHFVAQLLLGYLLCVTLKYRRWGT